MSSDGPTIQERIRSAVRRREAGDVAGARAELEGLREVAASGSTFDWLFFAHSFADVQEDPARELAWDQVAFEAVGRLSEQEVVDEGVPGGKAGLLPSLHLNLADVYRRLGDNAAARRHFDSGREYLPALDDGPYGSSVRDAFRRFDETPSAD